MGIITSAITIALLTSPIATQPLQPTKEDIQEALTAQSYEPKVLLDPGAETWRKPSSVLPPMPRPMPSRRNTALQTTTCGGSSGSGSLASRASTGPITHGYLRYAENSMILPRSCVASRLASRYSPRRSTLQPKNATPMTSGRCLCCRHQLKLRRQFCAGCHRGRRSGDARAHS
jgi:hypothetical protein